MFLHTSTQSDLLSDLCTHRVGEDDLGEISLDGADAAACRQRADVHHQHLVLRQLLDLQTHTNITTTFKIFCYRKITFLHRHTGYRSHTLLFYSPKISNYISHNARLTLAAFLSPSVRTPSSLLRRK